jgi:hypothetical protein
MVMNFGQQANQNTDTENFNGLVNSISSVCEDQNSGGASFGTVKEYRFRQHIIKINENNEEFRMLTVGNTDEEGEEQASRNDVCGVDLSFETGSSSSIDTSDGIELATGAYEFEIEPLDAGGVKLTINAN